MSERHNETKKFIVYDVLNGLIQANEDYHVTYVKERLPDGTLNTETFSFRSHLKSQKVVLHNDYFTSVLMFNGVPTQVYVDYVTVVSINLLNGGTGITFSYDTNTELVTSDVKPEVKPKQQKPKGFHLRRIK